MELVLIESTFTIFLSELAKLPDNSVLILLVTSLSSEASAVTLALVY